MGLVEEIETDYQKSDVPDFSAGDTVEVHVLIREGGAERIQRFEGYVISRKGEGLSETFTVRKIVQGEGVERTFPIHSPRVDKIEVLQTGRVRRSKLYYLSDRKGKSARIEHDTQGRGGDDESAPSSDTAEETEASDESSGDESSPNDTEQHPDAAEADEQQERSEDGTSDTAEEEEVAADEDEETAEEERTSDE